MAGVHGRIRAWHPPTCPLARYFDSFSPALDVHCSSTGISPNSAEHYTAQRCCKKPWRTSVSQVPTRSTNPLVVLQTSVLPLRYHMGILFFSFLFSILHLLGIVHGMYCRMLRCSALLLLYALILYVQCSSMQRSNCGNRKAD